MIRLLIADGPDLLSDALVAYFAHDDDIQTQTATTLDEACTLIATDPPFDLVLLDELMPGMNGLAGLSRAVGLDGGQRVALMSGVANRAMAEAALAAGAAGFVPKTMPARSLVNAVRFMALGEQFIPAELLTLPPKSSDLPLFPRLTPRELQVLQGLRAGRSNKEIARDLDLKEPTVKLYVKTLYRKLGVANRTQAALIACEAGLV